MTPVKAGPSGPTLATPSGRALSTDDLKLISKLTKVGFFTREEREIILKSKKRSHLYVHGREDLTDNPRMLRDLCIYLLDYVLHTVILRYPSIGEKRIGLIGVPTAATKLTQGIANEDVPLYQGESMFFRIMRTEKKAHGTNNTWVDGKPDLKKHFYIGLENVTTSTASLLDASSRMREDGYPVEDMPWIIFVDRGKNTTATLNANGLKHVHVVFTLADVAFALVHLGTWPYSYYEEAAREVA